MEAINEKLLENFYNNIQLRYFIKDTDIEVHMPCIRLKNETDFLCHAISILSDIQEMLKSKSINRKKINNELNEAKFFITIVLDYLIQKLLKK